MRFRIVLKTFRYRLAPTPPQKQLFSKFAGSCRYVFNFGLAARKASYEAERRRLTYFEQCKALTSLKRTPETSWLKEVHSQVLQQSLKDLEHAFTAFFLRLKSGDPPGFPKFKKKGQRDSFRYPQGVKAADGRLYLPGIGWVPYRDSRPIEGCIRETTVKREGDHWFANVVCAVEIPVRPSGQIDETRVIGIDLGLVNFAFLSDGTKVENPKFLRKALVKLRKAQRKLSRRTAKSQRWKKQLRNVVRLCIKVKNSRQDFAHKLSTTIVKSHDVIAVEDLNIKSMIRNRHLSGAIADAGWGRFITMLEYKADWAGKHFIKVERFLATSQLCSRCGLKRPMPLSVRTYYCASCGLFEDRDWNASLNIRAAGLVVLKARGGA